MTYNAKAKPKFDVKIANNLPIIQDKIRTYWKKWQQMRK
jgi:hypothetical protein